MKRGSIALGFVTILLLSVVFPLFNIKAPQAAASSYPFSFQDQATISGNVGLSGIGSMTFFDKDIYDTNYNYAPQNPPANVCNPGGTYWGITLTAAHPNFQNSSLKATVNLGIKVGVNCVPLSLASPEYINNPVDSTTGLPAGRTDLQWDGSWIGSLTGEVPTGEDSWQSLSGVSGLYSAQTTHNGSCGSYGAILLDSGSTHLGTEYQFVPAGSSGAIEPATAVPKLAPAYTAGSGCLIAGIFRVVIGGTQGTTPPGGGGGGASSPGVSCDLGITGLNLSSIFEVFNPLNWLLCGLIQGADGIVNQLDSAITSWLVVGTNGSTSTDDPTYIFADKGQCSSLDGSSGNGPECADYYTAWAAFRDLALGLLAIICLGIIIAQALGMDILDAYTIRKMLPRVVAGAIILTISWPLMRFFVILSNDLGYGVGNLLNAPFSGIGTSFHTGNVFTDIGAFIGGLSLGFFGLLSFVGTAALAVIVAF